MAFETRKPGDPATARTPRKRAAARALEAIATDPVPPGDVVADPAGVAVPAQGVFGGTRPKRVRRAPEPVAAVPAESGEQRSVVAEPVEAGPGGFSTRATRQRRTTSSSSVTSAPLASAPSVEEPASLLRDDRIGVPPVVERLATPAPAAPATAHSPAPVLPAPAASAEPETDGTHEAVVMTLGGGRYGIAMDAVDEVGRLPSVTRVPGLPAWLAGVANWRGRILAVVDLRPLLGAPQSPLGRNGRLVVCTTGGVTIGLLTEHVEGVVTVIAAATEQPLVTLAGQTAALVAGQVGHARGPIALLDLDAVFALRSQLPRARRAG
ncbi:MAG: CheW protein [Frankiales bacterium]|nr:CheW protein [Frankiales bacterium]